MTPMKPTLVAAGFLLLAGVPISAAPAVVMEDLNLRAGPGYQHSIVDVIPGGVTVNAICPGYTRTPLVENQIPALAREHGMSDADVVERIMLNVHAVKRLVEPDEIAAMVAYLCSDAAAMVTGTALPIDAGWTAR